MSKVLDESNRDAIFTVELTGPLLAGVVERARALEGTWESLYDPDWEPSRDELGEALCALLIEAVGDDKCPYCGAEAAGEPPRDGIRYFGEPGEGIRGVFEIETDYSGGGCWLSAVTDDGAVLRATDGCNTMATTMIEFCPKCGRRIGGW